MRSALLMVALTAWSTYSLVAGISQRARGHAFPHGNPLVYSFAVSWLIAITIAVASGFFSRWIRPTLFSPALWEKEGEIYARADLRAFRWLLLNSPLGWINPNLHLTTGRVGCDRLLREMNTSEGIHWLTCVASTALAISYLVEGHAVYGYVLLLVRIPFDLYPIMLHRWNRGRVLRILARLDRSAPLDVS